MAGLDDFARRMNRIAVQVEGNVEKAVRDCAGAVAKSVIEYTPADTGRAISNWSAQLDGPFVGERPANVPGIGGSTAEANRLAAIDQGLEIISRYSVERNGSIHISNNLPYIGALNDGHSKQAPADFVRIAVMEGLATVKGAKIIKD